MQGNQRFPFKFLVHGAVEAAKATQESDRDDEPKSGTNKGKRTTKRRLTSEEDPNQGVLLLDATCAPQDMAYPTDLNLLNEAREKLKEIIFGTNWKYNTYIIGSFVCCTKKTLDNQGFDKPVKVGSRRIELPTSTVSKQPTP